MVIKDSADGLKEINSLRQTYNLAKGAINIKVKKNEVNFSMPKSLNILMFTTNNNNKFIMKDFHRSVKPFNIEDSNQIILESNRPIVTTIILLDSDAYPSKITRPMIEDDILYYYKENKKHQINLN